MIAQIDIFSSKLIYLIPHVSLLVEGARFFSFEGVIFKIVWLALAFSFLKKLWNTDGFKLVVLSMGIAVTVLLVNLLKVVIHRPRPLYDDNLRYIVMLKDYSFPSLHSAFAWLVAYMCGVWFPKHKKLFYILAGCVSFSRVYLGYHYISDVIAGAGIGFGIGYLLIKMLLKSKK